MKNLLAFLAAAVLVFVGVGWYLDWFHVNSAPAAMGHQAISIDLDAAKMASDVQKGGAKVADAIEKARQEAEARKAEADKNAASKDAKPEPKKPEAAKGGK